MYVANLDPPCVFAVNLYDVPMFGGSMTEAEFYATKIEYRDLDSLLRAWNID